MIRAEQLSKRYTLYNRPLDRLHDWFAPASRRRGRPFWALRDITLDVASGTSLGIVGVNGAGKSTLLKILTGTTVPTEGTFSIEGRVSALLELGMGFHMEFTGRQNIEMNGKLSGLGDAELRAKTPGIIAFSELEAFIDQPLRTYSSGMVMRLAFAVASSVDPSVLIVDEALAVGDLHFQQKCLKRIREFHERGVTVLFVSHDPSLVKSFCDEAILLDSGRLLDRGKPDSVLDHYNALLAEKYRDEGRGARILRPEAMVESEGTTEAEDKTYGHRAGNFGAVITRVWIESTGTSGNASILTPGTEAVITVRAIAMEPLQQPTIGIQIKDRLGNEVYGTNTRLRGHEIGNIGAGEALEVQFGSPLNLGSGHYTITAAVHQGLDHTEICYDWIEQAETFQILPSPLDVFSGVCRLPMRVEHRVGAATTGEIEKANRLLRDSPSR